CDMMSCMIAGFVRVSSRAQDLGMQKAAIERAAAARGDTIEVWYSEKRSGKLLARPELDRLRADARAGRVGRVYLFRLDRLTRRGTTNTFKAVEKWRPAGDQHLNRSGRLPANRPGRRGHPAVMAWAAKMERLAINERISAARERVEAEGGKWGRPPRLGEEQ